MTSTNSALVGLASLVFVLAFAGMAQAGPTANDVECNAPCISASEVMPDVATQAELDSHANDPAAHHEPTVDTNAATLCPSNTFLSGDGTCLPLTPRPEFLTHANDPAAHHEPTIDTNAATICAAGEYLNGDGSCQVLADSNAATICAAGEYLNGDGSCQVIVDTNAATECATGEVLDGDGICRNLDEILERLAALEDKASRFVFVTSGLFTGDLATEGGGIDGLEGADNLCQAAADSEGAAVPPGTYRAWLSTDTVDAKDRIGPHFGPYVRPDGTVVAKTLTDLLDSNLDAVINLDEFAVDVGSDLVWTGTLPSGLADLDNCTNWTDGTDATFGEIGSSGELDGQWTDLTSIDCQVIPSHLYCFQVSDDL